MRKLESQNAYGVVPWTHQTKTPFSVLALLLVMTTPALGVHKPGQSPENCELSELLNQSDPQSSTPKAPSPKIAAPEYVSPLKSFKKFGDAKKPTWKGANENVGKIGGWRVYAKEAFEEEAEEKKEAPKEANDVKDGGGDSE